MAIKKKILVDVSYGMSFRNIILNKNFWDRLTKEYEVHLITPLKIDSKDQKDLNISLIIDSTKFIKNFINKIFLSINLNALHIRRLMDLSDFFLRQQLGWPLVSRYHETYRNKEELNQALFFWPAIKRTSFGKHLRKIVYRFPLFHPASLIFKNNDYHFLINSHNSEYNSVLIAQIAERNNIPIVGFPMGLDNIMHGPFLFNPDLLFFWGPDQELEFNKVQLPWNKNLKSSKNEMLGNLIFDTINETKDSEVLGCDDQKITAPFLLFTTMPEDDHPGQEIICRTIVNYLKNNNLPHKLVIRLRPGHDESIWEEFKEQNINEVILQIPLGTSFDKSGKKNKIDLIQETKDVAIYSSTLSKSCVVISRALSTTYTDALFVGTPAITTQYYPQDEERSKGFHRMWDQICTFYPHYKNGYKFAFSENDLIEFLSNALQRNKEELIDEDQINLLNRQFYSSSETAGDRAFNLIKENFS
ncbi:hypothetical protein N9S24_01770 [SAR86 cluster bacterium]|nr:hypothetical protein [SAR86 cluster bacterium]